MPVQGNRRRINRKRVQSLQRRRRQWHAHIHEIIPMYTKGFTHFVRENEPLISQVAKTRVFGNTFDDNRQNILIYLWRYREMINRGYIPSMDSFEGYLLTIMKNALNHSTSSVFDRTIKERELKKRTVPLDEETLRDLKTTPKSFMDDIENREIIQSIWRSIKRILRPDEIRFIQLIYGSGFTSDEAYRQVFGEPKHRSAGTNKRTVIIRKIRRAYSSKNEKGK
ncbi:MAG: hypothetical protein V1776_01225 [Candidatus Diapherotrites archaeon]